MGGTAWLPGRATPVVGVSVRLLSRADVDGDPLGEPQARDWVLVLRDTLAAGRSLPEPPPGTPGPFGLADPDDVQRVLTAAGFDDVELAEVREPMYLGADGDDAFSFVAGLGLTRGLLGGLDNPTRQAALEALRDLLNTHATPDGVLLGAAGWLVTAHRP